MNCKDCEFWNGATCTDPYDYVDENGNLSCRYRNNSVLKELPESLLENKDIEIEELKRQLERVVEIENKLISVKEKLPEFSGNYLTLSDTFVYQVLSYSTKHQLWNAYDFMEEAKCAIINITWWSQLPVPSEEEGHRDDTIRSRKAVLT